MGGEFLPDRVGDPSGGLKFVGEGRGDEFLHLFAPVEAMFMYEPR